MGYKGAWSYEDFTISKPQCIVLYGVRCVNIFCIVLLFVQCLICNALGEYYI